MLKNLRYYISFFLLVITVVATNKSFAIQTITISKGKIDPIAISINEFESSSKESTTVATSINEVIKNNLSSSGLFRVVPNAAFIENKIGIDHRPFFPSWRQINSVVLLNAKVQKISQNRFEIKIILWDVINEKEIIAESTAFPANLWRRAAHKLSDKIYEKIVGTNGYFDTKISYISETFDSVTKKKIKRLAIMDQDGANHRYLTDGKNIVLTPRFSHDVNKLMYISFEKKIAKVFLRDINTNKHVMVGNFKGMSFAPRFSPDKTRVIMSIARDGNTNIVEIDLRNGKMRYLTNDFAINTSPSYSPDGKKIYFNSDRSGTKQLYAMNSDGTDVNRISFGNGSYFSPVCSPNGEYIAFTKISDQGFSIGIMKPDGSRERMITTGYLVEGPTWSPNSRIIMYTREMGPIGKTRSRSYIYMVDLIGYFEKQIPTPHEASDPEWSDTLE